MQHDYDFLPLLEETSTNTSLKSVASTQPSQEVVQNILDFARCCQQITSQRVKLKICLN